MTRRGSLAPTGAPAAGYSASTASQPSRFTKPPATLVDRGRPVLFVIVRPSEFSHYEFRTNLRPGRRVKEAEPAYAYEDEDQTTGMTLRPGMRVRHPQFGVGSVISVEALDDDTKLVVRFAAVGQKTLRAKYARLEPA